MTRWNDTPINPNLSLLSLGKTKIKAVLGGGTKTAAGAIEWSSAGTKTHLYTHAIKVFEESRETFFKKFLWSPKAKRGCGGGFFQKAPPQKVASFKKFSFPRKWVISENYS